jgi:hypothetical protein
MHLSCRSDSISSLDSIGASHAHAVYTRALDLLAREGISIGDVDMSSSSEAEEGLDEWDRYSQEAKEIVFGEHATTESESDEFRAGEDDAPIVPSPLHAQIHPHSPAAHHPHAHGHPHLHLHVHASSMPDVSTILEAAEEVSSVAGDGFAAGTHHRVERVHDEEESETHREEEEEEEDFSIRRAAGVDHDADVESDEADRSDEPGKPLSAAQTPEGARSRTRPIRRRPLLILPVHVHTSCANHAQARQVLEALHPTINAQCASHQVDLEVLNEELQEWNSDLPPPMETDEPASGRVGATSPSTRVSLPRPSNPDEAEEDCAQHALPLHVLVQEMTEKVDINSLVKLIQTIQLPEKGRWMQALDCRVIRIEKSGFHTSLMLCYRLSSVRFLSRECFLLLPRSSSSSFAPLVHLSAHSRLLSEVDPGQPGALRLSPPHPPSPRVLEADRRHRHRG